MKNIKIYHIFPLIPFSTITIISIAVKRSNFALVYFKAACHANPGAESTFTGSGSHIWRKIFLKFSKTSADNNVSHEYTNHDIILNFLF